LKPTPNPSTLGTRKCQPAAEIRYGRVKKTVPKGVTRKKLSGNQKGNGREAIFDPIKRNKKTKPNLGETKSKFDARSKKGVQRKGNQQG